MKIKFKFTWKVMFFTKKMRVDFLNPKEGGVKFLSIK